MINPFTEGNNRTKNRLNEIVKSANTADNLSRRLKREILNRIPRRQGGGGEGSTIQLVYCKEDAGDSRSITGYMGYDELNVRVWLATTTYIVDDKVTYDNKLWRSLNAANLNHTPAEDAYWTEITDYNEETEYAADDWTLYRNKLWRCKTTSTGDVPQEGTYWTTKAKAWSDATTYVVGNRVTNGGKLYRSILLSKVVEEEPVYNIDHTPGDAEDPGWWTEIEEVEVYCDIAGGRQLNFSYPLLFEQQKIRVEYNTNNARYEATTLFQAAEESCAEGGMLELVSLQQAVAHDNATTSFTWTGVTPGLDLLFYALACSTYVVDLSIIYAQTGTAAFTIDGPPESVSVGGMFICYAGTTILTAYLQSVTAGDSVYARGEFIIQTGATAGIIAFMHKGSTIKVGSNMKYRRINYAAGTL